MHSPFYAYACRNQENGDFIINSAGKILVISDKSDLHAFVRTALEPNGFTILEAPDGKSALAKYESYDPAVIILDLFSGESDGIKLCREIRRQSKVPIIILTDCHEEIDEAMFLEAGADDYIIKPVSAQILILRVATQIRHQPSIARQTAGIFDEAGMSLNVETRQFQVRHVNVALTRTEFDFLRLLMEYPKRVHTRMQVIEAIGGSSQYSSDHLLDTHASRMRTKIRIAGGPAAISAVRGVGFRLMPPPEPLENYT